MKVSLIIQFIAFVALIVYISCEEQATPVQTEQTTAVVEEFSPNPQSPFTGDFDEFGSKSFVEMVEKYRDRYTETVNDEDFNVARTGAASLDYLYKQDQGRSAFSDNLSGNPTERLNWKMCVKIWGKFCGPGYCDNKMWDGCKDRKVDQKKCNYYPSNSANDAIDVCCRTHDRCCVENRGKSCNHCESEMVKCLGKAKTNGFSAGAMRLTMHTFFKVRSGCC